MQEQKEGTAAAPRAGGSLLHVPRLGALGEAVGGVFFALGASGAWELVAIWGGIWGIAGLGSQE